MRRSHGCGFNLRIDPFDSFVEDFRLSRRICASASDALFTSSSDSLANVRCDVAKKVITTTVTLIVLILLLLAFSFQDAASDQQINRSGSSLHYLRSAAANLFFVCCNSSKAP
jgi:hypothetical protein